MSAKTPWTEPEFVGQLRAKGARYHIHHPFQVLMNEGRLDQSAGSAGATESSGGLGGPLRL